MPEEEKEPEMTEEEVMTQLQEIAGAGTHTTHTFLHNVAVADDTTKTGFLTEDEVGLPKLPLRTWKELSLFCKDVANMSYLSDYFNKKAEIMTSTSLAKDAKLLTLAVLQRREIQNIAGVGPQKENKGWFKKKKRTDQPVSQYA